MGDTWQENFEQESWWVKSWRVVEMCFAWEEAFFCIWYRCHRKEKGLYWKMWFIFFCSHKCIMVDFGLPPFYEIKWGQERAGSSWMWEFTCCTGWVKREVMWSEEFVYPDIWGKNSIICVEMITYVSKLYVERRVLYEGERCDIELAQWVIWI